MFSREQYVYFNLIKENKRNSETISSALFYLLPKNIKFPLNRLQGDRHINHNFYH